MVCRLTNAKPSSKPMLIHCWLDIQGQSSIRWYFHWRNCVSKYRLSDVEDFVSASMSLPFYVYIHIIWIYNTNDFVESRVIIRLWFVFTKDPTPHPRSMSCKVCLYRVSPSDDFVSYISFCYDIYIYNIYIVQYYLMGCNRVFNSTRSSSSNCSFPSDVSTAIHFLWILDLTAFIFLILINMEYLFRKEVI